MLRRGRPAALTAVNKGGTPMKKRILSILCVLALCLSLLPVSVLAAGTKEYLVLGDSISTGYGLNDPSKSFAEQVAEAKGYTLDNQAKDGETTDSLAGKLTTLSSNIAAADLITITIGGNDLMDALYDYLADEYNEDKEEDAQITAEAAKEKLMSGDLTFLSFAVNVVGDFAGSTQAKTALAAFGTNLGTIVGAIKQANADVTLLVATQYNPYSYLAKVYGTQLTQAQTISDAFDTGVKALNGTIEAVVNQAGFTVVDVYTAFEKAVAENKNPCNPSVEVAVPPKVNLDFHPNQTGHDLIAEAVLAALPESPADQGSITGVEAATGLVYNGAPQQGYTGTPALEGYEGEFAVTYAGRNDTSYSEATQAPTDAGDYTVTISAGDVSLELNFSIAKKPITISVADLSVDVGEEVELRLSYQGVVTGNAVKLSAEPEFTLTDTNGKEIALADAVKTAGTYTITWTNAAGTTLVGEGNGNYDATLAETGKLTVNEKSDSGSDSEDEDDYEVSVDSVKNGSVTVSPARAEKGDTVTITVKPDEGYELKSLFVLDEDGDALELTDKGDGKYTFEMPAGEVTVEATFQAVKVESPVDDLLDVASGTWYYEGVKYAVESGMMTGVTTYTFEPNTTLSRGMIAQMLYALEGKPSVSATGSFSDVPAEAWFAKAANWTQSKGIITGYDDGSFGPNDPLTREQLALILYNYAVIKGYDTSTRANLGAYVDGSSTSSWAQTALSWAVGEGLLSGKGLDMLYPTGSATRAEVALIMMNFCENVTK